MSTRTPVVDSRLDLGIESFGPVVLKFSDYIGQYRVNCELGWKDVLAVLLAILIFDAY